MIKKLSLILFSVCCFVFAQQELLDLYSARMLADKAGNTPEIQKIDSQLAQSYLNLRKYSQARFFLENAIAQAEGVKLNDLKLDLYRLDIIESEFDRAESGLINIYFYSDSDEQRIRAAYLLGVLNALKGKYEESRKYLTQSMKMSGKWSEDFELRLDDIIKDAKMRKNRETARWMSTFLPGSGQIYAKNAKGAIGAIGIAVFWGGWFTYSLLEKDYYSALLTLVWPWQRYHRGNIQNAEYSVDDYNAMIEEGINRELLEYLSQQ